MTTQEGACLIRIVIIMFWLIVERSKVPTLANPPEALSVEPGMSNPPIPSKGLFNGGSCVFIEHEGMIYALKTTRAGKLILTK